MSLEVDAIYEDGVLKPDRPLPLAPYEKFRVVVQQQPPPARQGYGIIGWQGDPEVVRQIAIEPDYRITAGS